MSASIEEPSGLARHQSVARGARLLDTLTWQLQHGCDNTACATSTCFTSRTRDAPYPLRKYTYLSARSIALALATHHRVRNLICPCIEIDRVSYHDTPLPARIDPKSLLQHLCTTNAIRGLAARKSTPLGQKRVGPFPKGPIKPIPKSVSEKSTAISLADLVEVNLWMDQFLIHAPYRESDAAVQSDELSEVAEVRRYLAAVFSDADRLSASFLDISLSEGFISLALAFQLGLYISRSGEDIFKALNSSVMMLTTDTRTNVTKLVLLCVYALTSTVDPVKVIDINPDMSFHAYELLKSLLAACSARIQLIEAQRNHHEQLHDLRLIFHRLIQSQNIPSQFSSSEWDGFYDRVKSFILCIQLLIVKEWPGGIFISTQSTVGSALVVLEAIRKVWPRAAPDKGVLFEFAIPQLSSSLDVETACCSWLNHQPKPNERHILSYSFLFSHTDQSEFFRTCCHQKMRLAVRETAFAIGSRHRILRHSRMDVDEAYLDRMLKTASKGYLVLEIRRDDLLSDAFDQLWQREQRELRRPLRVRIGSEEGEIGHDLGGPQIEFFNLFCNEMCDPQRGILKTDPTTHLSWFTPGSLEPLHRYESFGILFGIALFNGITLPISLPRVFYAKLMGLPVTWAYLHEDWPDISMNFESIAEYNGDVEADLALEHSYVMQANGLSLSIDMLSYEWRAVSGEIPGEYLGTARVHEIWHDRTHKIGKMGASGVLPQQSHEEDPTNHDQPDVERLEWPGWRFVQSEAPRLAVTNQNRSEYLESYARWLFDYSIRPQFYAFAAGFYRVIDIRALRLLTPNIFQDIVEGSQVISVDILKDHAKYEGYTPSSQHIMWLWSIVSSYDQEKLRKLLEFITASKRMPANGAPGLRLEVMLDEGAEHKLPSSHTCFARLLLPRYRTREIMKEKLDIALEHSIGFGAA